MHKSIEQKKKKKKIKVLELKKILFYKYCSLGSVKN